MKVKVKPGWQLGIEGDKVYQPGEILNVPDPLAQQWIAAGQASAVKAEKPAPKPKKVAPKPKVKAVKASKNKAVTSSANKAVSTPTMTPTVTAPPITVISKP